MGEIASLYLVNHEVKARFPRLLSLLLNDRIPHHTVFIHQVAQELWAQTDGILCSWVLREVFLEENGEPRIPIESLWAEIAERVAIGHIYKHVFLNVLRHWRIELVVVAWLGWDSSSMSPSWSFILKSTSENLLRVSARSEASSNLCV